MKNISSVNRGNVSGCLIFCMLLLISGCATSSIPIFAHTTSNIPPLSGKTVAVLPPATVGSEARNTIVTQQAMDAVFSGDIAGVHFKNGGPRSSQIAAAG